MDGSTERGKGEYLDMDEDKRHQLDEQAQEYVDDAPALPAMNADPGERDPEPDSTPTDSTERVES